jgi:hypothetical protein
MNKQQKNTLVVISCYGILDNTKHDVEVSGLHKYLERSVAYILDLKKQDAGNIVVIVSGGYSESNKNISESLSYKSLLEQALIQDNVSNNVQILYETISLNHSQHVAFSLLMAQKYQFEDVIFICDTNFAYKLHIIASGLIDQLFNWKIVDFKRDDIHPDNILYVQNYDKLPREIFSPQYKALQSLMQVTFVNKEKVS